MPSSYFNNMSIKPNNMYISLFDEFLFTIRVGVICTCTWGSR